MTDLTFEEGPFFFVTSTRPDKRYIIWATNATTATQLYQTREALYPSHLVHAEYIGGLEDVKREYLLSPTQIADLHREGYLKL